MTTRLFASECCASTLVLTLLHDLHELDFIEIEQEGEILCHQLAGDPSLQNVLIDFGRTDYLGSSTLSLLLMILKQVKARKGRLVLCNLTANENEVLAVTKLNSLIQIFLGRQEALDALQG